MDNRRVAPCWTAGGIDAEDRYREGGSVKRRRRACDDEVHPDAVCAVGALIDRGVVEQ